MSVKLFLGGGLFDGYGGLGRVRFGGAQEQESGEFWTATSGWAVSASESPVVHILRQRSWVGRGAVVSVPGTCDR